MVVWGLWNKPDPQTLRPSCHYNMFANTKIEFAFRVEQPLGDSALHEVGIWMNGSILTVCALVVYCLALLYFIPSGSTDLTEIAKIITEESALRRETRKL